MKEEAGGSAKLQIRTCASFANKKEPLTKCTRIEPTALLKVARLREDERIIVHLRLEGVDAVAANVVYHRSCCQEYINPKIKF